MKQLLWLTALLMLIAASCNRPADQSEETNGSDIKHKSYFASEHICTYCGEQGESDRFGGMIVTGDDYELPFTSVECLAGFVLKSPEYDENSEIWVVDYNGGERVVPLSDARFIITDLLNSPNGLNIISYTGKERLDDNLLVAYGGEVAVWDDILAYVNEQWTLNAR